MLQETNNASNARADSRRSIPATKLLELRYGRYKVLLPEQGAFVFYGTFVVGEYDSFQIRESDVVLDAGANVGDFTIMAAEKTGDKGRVVALEPHPYNAYLLRKNLARNHVSNVTVIEAALSGHNGMIQMNDAGALSHVSKGKPSHSTIEVGTVNLDSLLERLGLDKFDILKIDVEGAETDALAGQACLGRAREIIIEVHGKEASTNIQRILSDRGFITEFLSWRQTFTRIARNGLRHLPSVLHSETMTRALATRLAFDAFVRKRTNPVPALRSAGNVRIIHAWRSPSDTANSPAQNATSPSPNHLPTFSLLVPTFNEEHYLPAMLRSIKEQTLADYELIVVDGGSRDKTLAIAKDYTSKIISSDTPPNLGRHVNFAAQLAVGKYISKLDADAVYPREWLATVYNTFERHPELVGVTGPITPLPEAPFWLKLEYVAYNMVRRVLVRFPPPAGTVLTSGQNTVVLSRAFHSVGGYVGSGINEDGFFGLKVSKLGRLRMIDLPVYHSPRKARALGFFRFNKYFSYILSMVFPFNKIFSTKAWNPILKSSRSYMKTFHESELAHRTGSSAPVNLFSQTPKPEPRTD